MVFHVVLLALAPIERRDTKWFGDEHHTYVVWGSNVSETRDYGLPRNAGGFMPRTPTDEDAVHPDGRASLFARVRGVPGQNSGSR